MRCNRPWPPTTKRFSESAMLLVTRSCRHLILLFIVAVVALYLILEPRLRPVNNCPDSVGAIAHDDVLPSERHFLRHAAFPTGQKLDVFPFRQSRTAPLASESHHKNAPLRLAHNTTAAPGWAASNPADEPLIRQGVLINSKSGVYRYDSRLPLIFIGGMPRSGTTLMRAMLDSHPDVRCGTETRLVPRILSMRHMWLKSTRETTRLTEAGIGDDVINAAVRAFIIEIIVRHGELAPRLCNKDPFTMKSAVYLAQLFPNARFVFMIRDGRATVHSIITRRVTITGFNLKDYRQCMEKWNQAMTAMWAQCEELGTKRCLPVHYEELVLHPRRELQRLLHFLALDWNETLLHHDRHINEQGGVYLSKAERSTDQVIKPLHSAPLYKWIDGFPPDVLKDVKRLAPMMETLGYDATSRSRSQYGAPDPQIVENNSEVSRNSSRWRDRQLASVLKGSAAYKQLVQKDPT